MKTVLNHQGVVVEVADNTPCHAGVNGELPIMLDKIKDKKIFDEITEREKIWQSKAKERAKQEVIDNRNKERGSWQDQLEYMLDNGLEALQDRDNAIKAKFPKIK